MRRIVVASNNAGKIREIGAILSPHGLQLVAQSELGVGEADEPHVTFVENALAKARYAARHTGLTALADDSGICVDALGGAPGVHSARFAGEPKSDARNNARLIELLQGKTNRRAHYYAVIVLLRHADDPQPLIAEGTWHGEILPAPRGSGGFGYDPLFLDPLSGMTGAQMAPEDKNRVSHRGKALAALVARLPQFLADTAD